MDPRVQPANTPDIVVFVRHSPGCKFAGDEFARRCNCRKHLRWSLNGKQFRRKAGTRSWVEADEVKRKLADQLAGRTPAAPEEVKGQLLLRDAVATFEASKKAQGSGASVLRMYKLELKRLCDYCEGRGLYTATAALTLENLLAYRETWPAIHKSSYARAVVQGHIRTFINFAYGARWISYVPKLSPIKNTQPETQPLTDEEYKRVLKSANSREHALIELMRHSGLAVRDACTLKRSDILQDGGLYKVVRRRTKTGEHLYIPIPAGVAKEVLAVPNDHPQYVFWDKRKLQSSEASFTSHWSSRVAKVFELAQVESQGHMVSHRLRDTYACALLQRGVALEHVSRLLGHRSVTTTQKHYSPWIRGRQDLLDRVVSATWSKKR
ncbi:MAG TPA: tyrosine-type recombinase/integrase [Candidatus Sulfotelmatobacter sp.]|jgi:site-specific recombinase XerD|nr:tyrosine-type recombinase/integrase [Candidatus Sulfotelmatobacter sp.]